MDGNSAVRLQIEADDCSPGSSKRMNSQHVYQAHGDDH
jgi:hypothetical protein